MFRLNREDLRISRATTIPKKKSLRTVNAEFNVKLPVKKAMLLESLNLDQEGASEAVGKGKIRTGAVPDLPIAGCC